MDGELNNKFRSYGSVLGAVCLVGWISFNEISIDAYCPYKQPDHPGAQVESPVPRIESAAMNATLSTGSTYYFKFQNHDHKII